MATCTEWAAAGFSSAVIPIIPPGAKISTGSRIRPEAIGKIPGRLNGHGAWSGFDWLRHQTSEQDLAAWTAAGASVGLRGAEFPGLDIDVLDAGLADMIETEAKRLFGPAPRRTGRAPKRLLAYRSMEPLGHLALHFQAPGDDREQLVELLGLNQQFVADGVHAITRAAYSWDRHPVRSGGAAALTAITGEQVAEFFDALEPLLDVLGCTNIRRGGSDRTVEDRSSIDQEGLRGDPERLDEALALIGNTDERFPDRRGDYIAMGAAIKAAYGPDEEPRARERWLEWCAKWPGNDKASGNDPAAAIADWESLKPPYGVGADYLYAIAAEFGFDRTPELVAAFGVAPEPPAKPLPPISPIDFRALPNIAPAPREFLIEGWLPEGILSSLYGPPGIGKSLLAQLLATCIATGRELFGLAVKRIPVLGLFSEDDNDELARRQWAINREYGLRNEDLEALHIEGRSGTDNTLVTFPAGAPQIGKFAASITAKAREIGAGLIILDNRAQMILGNENDRMVATYGGNLCARIGRKSGAAVLLVGHPAKPVGSEYSGSTAWDAVTRSRWWLSRQKTADEDDEGAPPLLTLLLAKSNYAPAGQALTLLWANGVLRLADVAPTEAEQAEQEFRRDEARRAFLECLDRLAAQGRAVSHSPSSRTYGPKVMAEMELGFTRRELEVAMEELFATGLIVANAPIGKSSCRHPLFGIARTAEGAG